MKKRSPTTKEKLNQLRERYEKTCKMQLLINDCLFSMFKAQLNTSESHSMRLKRLEDMQQALADDIFGSDKETPTGLGLDNPGRFDIT